MHFSLPIGTLNCRGLSLASKQAAILELATAQNLDILLLQETYIHPIHHVRWFDMTSGTRSYWSCGTKHSHRVATILMPSFAGSVLHYTRDSCGRRLVTDLDSGVRVVNVYAPNKQCGQDSFFQDLDSELIGPTRLFLAGDFNCVLHMEDQSAVAGRRVSQRLDRAGAQALRSLVEELGLVDAWHLLQPARSGMTWSGRRLQSRIDHFYVSQSLSGCLHSAWIVPTALSDHKLVILRSTDPNWVTRGARPWRLNPKILRDPQVVAEVQSLLRSLVESDLDSDSWDALKDSVRTCLMAASKRLWCEEHQEIRAVSDVILLFSRPSSFGPGVTEALSTLRERLRELLKQRWDDLRAAAHAERWQMDSWYLRHLLRKRLARKHVSLCAVLDPTTGDTVEDPERVLAVTRDFYANLYTHGDTHPNLCPLDAPQEPPNIQGGPIQVDELLTALKGTKTGRSLGHDGLPVEFYIVAEQL